MTRLMTLVFLLILTAPAFAQNGPGAMGSGRGMMGGMMDCFGGAGMGVMMLVPLTIMVLFLALLILGVMALVKYLRRGD